MADFTGPHTPEAHASPLLERVQRRLQALAKVLNHDLPNQLVAIQGLVQLLALEENARLSADGQEYVGRLNGAAKRALDLAHGLKVLARLSTATERPERISLKDLAEEVAAEVKKLLPGCRLDYDFPVSAAEVNASRRLLCQALVELVCFAVSAASLASVRLGSERTGAGLVITLGPGGAEAATTSSAARRTPPTKIWEGRLEYLLAREFVEVAGGTLRFADDSGRGEWFSILVPLDGTASGNEGTAL